MRFFKLPFHFWSDIEAKYYSRQTFHGSRKPKYNLEKLSADLGRFVDADLNAMDHDLWSMYKSRGEKPGYGDNNLSKLKSHKDFTPSRDLIDLLCYYTYGKPYFKCVDGGEIQESDTSEYLLLKTQRDTEYPVIEKQDLNEREKRNEADGKDEPLKEPQADKDSDENAQPKATAAEKPDPDKNQSEIEAGLRKYETVIKLHKQSLSKRKKNSRDSETIILYARAAIEHFGKEEIEKIAELYEIIRKHIPNVNPDSMVGLKDKAVTLFGQKRILRIPLYIIVIIGLPCLLSYLHCIKLPGIVEATWHKLTSSNPSQDSLPSKAKPDKILPPPTSSQVPEQIKKAPLPDGKNDPSVIQKHVANPLKSSINKPDKKIIPPNPDEIHYFYMGDYSHIGSSENWEKSFVKEDLTNEDDNSIQGKDFTTESPVFYNAPPDKNNPFPISKGSTKNGLVRFRVIDILPIGSQHTYNLSLIFVKVKILSK